MLVNIWVLFLLIPGFVLGFVFWCFTLLVKPGLNTCASANQLISQYNFTSFSDDRLMLDWWAHRLIG